jgi:hypothetical protein
MMNQDFRAPQPAVAGATASGQGAGSGGGGGRGVRSEAGLVAESRIGGVPLRVLSARWGVPYEALRKRRMRAEPALVAWLLASHPGAIAPVATYRRGRSRGMRPELGSARTRQRPDAS